MKYTVVVIVLACLAAIFIGDGWVNTRRAAQKAQSLTARVSALSPQELAARVRDCDSGQPGRAGQPYDAQYCAEVMRVIDNQPLQIVTPPRRMPDAPIEADVD